jgi:hypothetical protein
MATRKRALPANNWTEAEPPKPRAKGTAPALPLAERDIQAELPGYVPPTQNALTLLEYFTGKDWTGLENATNVQRAICLAVEGRSLLNLSELPEVRYAFGGVAPEFAEHARPFTVVLLAAIRCGKSLLAATYAIVCARFCDLSNVGDTDEIIFPIVAVDLNAAKATFAHVVGLLTAPGRRWTAEEWLVDQKATECTVRHVSGREVKIVVAALARTGQTLIGRWLAGAIFDEAPRMTGEGDGVRNLDHSMRAIAGRILPGGQIWIVGSPAGPEGPVYELVQEHWGKPSKDFLVMRARGPDMNPVHWTPERVAELLAFDPVAHRNDVEAEFAEVESGIFSTEELDAASAGRQLLVIPPVPGVEYVATCDPGSRGPSWTLVIMRENDGLNEVVLATQWRGSRVTPLKPSAMFATLAPLLLRYGCDSLIVSQHRYEALRDIAADNGVSLVLEEYSTADVLQMLESINASLLERRASFPAENQLKRDLLGCKRKLTSTGVTASLPESEDGKQGGFVIPLCLAFRRPPGRTYEVAAVKGYEDEAAWEQRIRERSGRRVTALDRMREGRW